MNALYQTGMSRPRFIGLLLAFVTLVIYLPATSDQFINYDDPDYVVDNPVVEQGLTWAGLKWAFMGAHDSNWHPLTWLSHMADCDLFRLNPGGPHLVNILFHSLNAALLFLLLFQLTKKPWPSAFVAALFAWHPMHVESVAWIAERKDVLSTFFALLALLSYTRFVQESRRRSYWFALLFFALALLSKPMPVTLPFVMLLLDFWPLNRFETDPLKVPGSPGVVTQSSKYHLSIFWEKWPFFLLAAVSCVITFLAQHAVAVQSLTVVPARLRLENVLTAYAGYLWKMVWPVDLAIFYPLHKSIPSHLIAESAILLAGISIIVWLERKCSSWLVTGWLWFLVTLVPVIGLVQVGGQAMADRYSYFPLVGIFLAVAFSAEAVAGRFAFIKKWSATAAVLILGFCVLLTEKQLRYWRDSEALFTHALTVAQSDTAHISLGVALRAQNRMSEAMNQFIQAWLFNPDTETLACVNIAITLRYEGKLELAAVYYERAEKQKYASLEFFENYGTVLAKLGRFDEATNQFSAATRLDPFSAEPYFLMGRLLLQRGNDAEALMSLKKAVQLDPNNLDQILLAASVLATDENSKARNGTEALQLAERLVHLTGGKQPVALDTLAMANAELGRFDEAVTIQTQAIQLTETNGNKEDLGVMQKRLEFYQKHQPWRILFKQPPTSEKLNQL
jgi:protein O-mannosyl-transferase